MIAELLGFAGFSLIVLVVAWMIFALKSQNQQQHQRQRRSTPSRINQTQKKVAFLHPNCWDGGGGERTLWAAVVAIKKRCPGWKISVLCGSLPTEAKIKRVQNDFGMNIPFREIEFIALKSYACAESWPYPRLTRLGQALGSFIVAVEVAFFVRDASLLVDTIGYPFVYPILRGVFGIKVLAYVHYPFINYDILAKPSFKHVYNVLLIKAYSLVGRFVNIALCNSTWTFNHMLRLWTACERNEILFPPCDLTPFLANTRNLEGEDFVILSLSQFRPEKNHMLQLEIAQIVCKQLPCAKFILVGGCRNERDHERVEQLKRYASELGISASVQFLVNLPFPSLMKTLSQAHVGLHTMFEEHFGIGIVELMAAGLVTIAHDSGGPRADIIRPGKNGFLCSSAQEYAQTILSIAQMDQNEFQSLAEYARADVKKRFAGELFAESIVRVMKSQ